jgi:hypothetical protein
VEQQEDGSTDSLSGTVVIEEGGRFVVGDLLALLAPSMTPWIFR